MHPAQESKPDAAHSRGSPSLSFVRLTALFLLCLWVMVPGVRGQEDALGFRAAPWGRVKEVTVADPGRVGFTALPQQSTGITFSNLLSDTAAGLNQVRMNGSGVALGDVDGDGNCDIYFCGLEAGNRLYLNQGGWRFKDVTVGAGVSCPGQWSTGAMFADADGDGDLDLLVNSIGEGTRLFLNDGKGSFAERRDPALNRASGSMSMSMADLDGDGDLDLYVVNYRTNTIRSTGYGMVVDRKGRIQPAYVGQYEVTPGGRLLEFGEPDQLLLNDGKGAFVPASWTDGRFVDEDGRPLQSEPRDWGLSVMLRDFNGDGVPDIYVCNDFWSPDRLWLNDGHARFRAAPRGMLRHTSNSSMGLDVADIDRDGLDDFVVLDMLSPVHGRRLRQRGGVGLTPQDPARPDSRPQVERNTLFWNRGDGTYAEIACLAGLEASEWSWSTAFLDVDLDGYEDLLVTAGNLFDMQDDDIGSRMAASPRRPLAERLFFAPKLDAPNSAFRNRGDLTFENVAAAWGFDTVGVCHGMALADLDNDGDLDVVVNRLNGPAGVFRNEGGRPRLEVRLRGRPPNTRAVGARIQVSGGDISQSQTVGSGGRYLSSDEGARTFAAWHPTNRFTLYIRWAGGGRTRIQDLAANTIVEVDEAKAPPWTEPAVPAAPADPGALFSDESGRLGHFHRDAPHDDFAVQPMLSRRLDTPGPCVGWFDLDGDGREDLVLGGGMDGLVAVFRNGGQGDFSRWTNITRVELPGVDPTAVLGWHGVSGAARLIVGLAADNASSTNGIGILGLQPAAGGAEAVWRQSPAAVGAMAMADVDGDGDLDLFVGGRSVAGRYPHASASVVMSREGDGWKVDQMNSRRLAGVGIVHGAVWSDLDGDGDPDLLLACEWGFIQLWRNDGGTLTDVSRQAGLEGFTGWWNGIVSCDVDGDGRPDIVASNWGRNSSVQSQIAGGFRAYAGDFSGRGAEDFVEACLDRSTGRWTPWRDRRTAVRAMPWLQERFPTAAAYADAGLEGLFGEGLRRAVVLGVSHPESTVFLNRGGRFQAIPLPVEAQLSPAFGISAADFTGDGIEDLFLAQNFFGNAEGFCREDAGWGICLRGLGDGRFAVMGVGGSGIRIEGEQRGAAVGDFDADGRVDLVVGQHRGATRLFRNRLAPPGVRLRFLGPPGNPSGVGVQVQGLTRGRLGRLQEVRMGGGYASMDSTVLMLTGTPPDSVRVRWPWKTWQEVTLPSGAREVGIHPDGGVKVIR